MMIRQPIKHELKVHPQYFKEIKAGRKNWELRLNDRDFQIGDFLYLREYNPEEKIYTGNEIDNLEILYILSDYYALIENHVVISFAYKRMELLTTFLSTNYKNHVVFYNNKIVDMDYVEKKEQFKYGCMRIADNIAISDVGFIKSPKSEFYIVSRGSKTAKKITLDEIKKHFE